MKYFFKGIFLGFSVVAANRLCCSFFGSLPGSLLILVSAFIFFFIATAFLVSDKIPGLFLCGFTGIFVMFYCELSEFVYISTYDTFLIVYIGGLFGCVAAIIASLILSVKKHKISDIFLKEGLHMTNELKDGLKIKLLIYALISAIGFSYLVLPENAGISVPIFAVIQFLLLWFIAPDRKKLWLFIPVFIMSLNSFLSASNIWRFANLIISIVMHSCMFMNFNIKEDKLDFITNISTRIFAPFPYFSLPFKWMLEVNSGKVPVIKRVIIALCIAVPSVLVLTLILSNADMVFSLKAHNLMSDTMDIVSFNTIFKIVCGIAVGLFLFGAIYYAHTDNTTRVGKEINIKGDLIIINILLSSILFVYTLFVIIQFKYLFAGSTLPEGLTHTDYARKGFFELLALTVVNIAIILISIRLTKKADGKWFVFTKILCHYLCAVTVVLLVSSFYRMFLYTNDDGLTRLRFFVLGFLVFEAIGLLITFVYIAKPKFNICLIYTSAALVYYMILNVIPTDEIIAKNQIDTYLDGDRDDLAYIFTLSADAAPAIEFLLEKTTDEEIIKKSTAFLKDITKSDIPQRWQRYNLSAEKAKNILNNIH